MNPRQKSELLTVLAAVLVAWGVLLFFENAYFASFFYGVATPVWAAWVGDLPVWGMDAIDTVMVAVFLLAIVLSAKKKHRSLRSTSRGSVSGWILLLVGLFLVGAFLYLAGFNLAGLWADFKGFL
jgi:hypothetical protein